MTFAFFFLGATALGASIATAVLNWLSQPSDPHWRLPYDWAQDANIDSIEWISRERRDRC
jgi:hypothetical protein